MGGRVVCAYTWVHCSAFLDLKPVLILCFYFSLYYFALVPVEYLEWLIQLNYAYFQA